MAWRLAGWALQQPDEQALIRRFLGEWDLLDTDAFDLVVAALGLAVLEETWRCDTRPDTADVLLTGIAAHLDELADRRQVKPFDGGHPDDLWPRLNTADQTELDNAADLARQVLIAHTTDAAGPHPVSVIDRLDHCPHPNSTAMLERAFTRRQLDVYIKPRLARRIQTDGRFRVGDGDDGVLTCPHCGVTRRLQLACQTTGNDVTATCPAGHTWPVPQLTPSDIEYTIEQEAQRRNSS